MSRQRAADGGADKVNTQPVGVWSFHGTGHWMVCEMGEDEENVIHATDVWWL